ncbi:hypothetical protein [Amycolatopsis sp. NPDC049159]|uniref:hypothetical protein n=1 Tax=Amycolatopsis sp. NPDC049159 TaxID=3157210 RepID=UPI00340CF13E
MQDFWFEIIAVDKKAYSWVCYSGRRGKQRELAKSSRFYKSGKKARRAIRRLRGAGIGRPFSLPRTKFEIIPGVAPLIVRGTSSRTRPAASRSTAGTSMGPATGAPAADTSQPAAPTQPPPPTETPRAGEPQPRSAASADAPERPGAAPPKGNRRATRTRSAKKTAK